jgi:hypothetical protein
VIKPRVAYSSKVLFLDQGTTSGEIGMTKTSPSNSKPGGEKSTGKLPKFKLRETPIEGIIGK